MIMQMLKNQLWHAHKTKMNKLIKNNIIYAQSSACTKFMLLFSLALDNTRAKYLLPKFQLP